MSDMADLTRRSFLRSAMLALPALALPAQAAAGFTARRLGRITIDTVSVYSEPSDKSTILYQRKRDEVINLYDELISPDGPGYNPRWYKVWRGYIHCARVQAVAEVYNQPATSLPEGGQLGEITVPVSYPMYKRRVCVLDHRYHRRSGRHPMVSDHRSLVEG